MNVLILATQYTGTGLANRLIRECKSVDHLWLSTDTPSPGVWPDERFTLTPPPPSRDAVLEFVHRERIGLVVVYNAVYGTNGVVEALEQSGILCVGSNQRMAATEIHKQEFRRWLAANDFRTPGTVFEGSFVDVHQRIGEFAYPLVVKPQLQRGPAVTVCDDPTGLRDYLAKTQAQNPHARTSLQFAIEEYVPIREHLHVGYLLSHGRAYLDIALRVPSLREGGRRADQSECVVMRHPVGVPTAPRRQARGRRASRACGVPRRWWHPSTGQPVPSRPGSGRCAVHGCA